MQNITVAFLHASHMCSQKLIIEILFCSGEMHVQHAGRISND